MLVFFCNSRKRAFQTRKKYEMRAQSRSCYWQILIFRFHSSVSYASALFYIPLHEKVKSQCLHDFQPWVQLKSILGLPHVRTSRCSGAVLAILNIVQSCLVCPLVGGLDTCETSYRKVLLKSGKIKPIFSKSFDIIVFNFT